MSSETLSDSQRRELGDWLNTTGYDSLEDWAEDSDYELWCGACRDCDDDISSPAHDHAEYVQRDNPITDEGEPAFVNLELEAWSAYEASQDPTPWQQPDNTPSGYVDVHPR